MAFQYLGFSKKKIVQQAYSLPVGDTKAKLDLFYPFFLTIQFAFFFGWLKVTNVIIMIIVINVIVVIIMMIIPNDCSTSYSPDC